MLAKLQSQIKARANKAGSEAPAATPKPARPQPVQVDYTSNDVAVPASFLTSKPADAQPITIDRIDWARTPLPQYAGRYAAVLENVLSPSECAALLRLAEASAKPDAAGRTWRPALVNMGGNWEVEAADYRRSERIIWDAQEVADRIWRRCCEAPGLADDLAQIARDSTILNWRSVDPDRTWRFSRPNQRLRFLRYTEGMFFARHCDGPFELPGSDPPERTFYTLHLYLSAGAQGGQTTFWAARDEEGKGARRVDVDPVVGRVLIFQHSGLLHSGEEVTGGEKFTMRTDIMYTLDKDA